MYHNIRILSSRHTVHVISFVESEKDRDALKSIENICESVTAIGRIPDFRPHWLSLDPFLRREFATPQMHEAVDSAIRQKKVDVIQCEYLQMSQYRRRDIFSILTIHETLSANAYESFRRESDATEKIRLFYRWMQLLRYEIGAVRRFDRVVAMTDRDASYLRSYAPRAEIRAIPIGINVKEFSPFPEDLARPPEVLFVGNFRHMPNVEAARFIVREIAPAFPDVRFLMPGSNVPSDLGTRSNVQFIGYAPETRLLYRRPNTIVMAPLFSGTGQRVKLLEAFCMACPVITTPVGALGFPVRSGSEALLAETPSEFRAALRLLMASESLRRQLGERSREMIMRCFGWEQIGAHMLALVDEAAMR